MTSFQKLGVIIALFLSINFYSSSASADCSLTSPPNMSTLGGSCPDREQAYASCMVYSNYLNNNGFGTGNNCVLDGPAYYRSHNSSGGTNSYANWAWVNACPSGETWNDTSHVCETPVTCEAGKKKYAMQSQSIFTPELTQNYTADIDGCAYECNKTFTSHILINDAHETRYTCTGTGNPTTNEPPVDDSEDVPENDPPPPDENCTIVGGQKISIKDNMKDGCLTVNGVLTCQGSTPGEAEIGGEKVKADDPEPCVYKSGTTICVSGETNPDNTHCGTVNGVKTCFSNKSTITETEQTQTQPDGTVIKTTERKSNIKNDPSNVQEIRTTAPDGSVTVVRQGGDSGTLGGIESALGGLLGEGGGGTRSGSASDNCGTPPVCDGDAIDCAVLTQTWQTSCIPEETAITQQQIDDAMGVSAPPAGTTTDLSSHALDSSGLGLSRSCPAPLTASVLGKSMTVDLTEFCNLASILGTLIMITASFISLRIIAYRG